MPKCPHCGSTAQVRERETIYDENGWEIYVTRRYYALINRLWRKLYRAEHSQFVEEFLKARALAGGDEYWKAIIEYYMSEGAEG